MNGAAGYYVIFYTVAVVVMQFIVINVLSGFREFGRWGGRKRTSVGMGSFGKKKKVEWEFILPLHGLLLPSTMHCLYNNIFIRPHLWLWYYVLGNTVPSKQSGLLGVQEQNRTFLSNICSYHGHEFKSWTSENTWRKSISVIWLFTSHISICYPHCWENFTTKPFLLVSSFPPPGLK